MPNFTTFLDVNVKYWPRKTVAIFPDKGEQYTFSDLLERVNEMGNVLRELGVKRGDGVALYLPTWPEALIGFLAIWRIGAIAVPINIVLKDLEVQHILNNSNSKIAVTNTTGLEVVRKIRDKIPSLEGTVVVDKKVDGTYYLKELMEKASPSLRAENCEFDCLSQLQYTAGTTGLPKGAMLTHGNWMMAVEAERWAFQLTDKDVMLYIYPLVHVGASWGIMALKYGATVVFMERYKMDKYLRYIAEYGVTLLCQMPPVMNDLVNGPPGIEEYLRTVRATITGGGPTPPVIWEKWVKRFGIPVLNAYGLSETIVIGSAPGTVPGWDYYSKGYRSVGVPIGYTEVKIVDPKDPKRELEPGEIGEIALRGPSVAKGYWLNEEATKEAFMPNGWFLTGDLGYLDDDGALYVTDRKKDMIITSGFNIYPAEVENILLQYSKIKEVAVFAKYDERRGEVPAAAVVLKSGEKATEEEIVEWARQHMASYKVPRHVVILDEIPKMAGWKTLRRVLRERYGGFGNG